MNKGICKFYGDLDKAVEAARNANIFTPCDDGTTGMLKVADHPVMTVMVVCERFQCFPVPPVFSSSICR